jgi:hypothetical protein
MCSDQAVQVRGIEPVKVCGIRHSELSREDLATQKVQSFQFGGFDIPP